MMLPRASAARFTAALMMLHGVACNEAHADVRREADSAVSPRDAAFYACHAASAAADTPPCRRAVAVVALPSSRDAIRCRHATICSTAPPRAFAPCRRLRLFSAATDAAPRAAAQPRHIANRPKNAAKDVSRRVGAAQDASARQRRLFMPRRFTSRVAARRQRLMRDIA